MARLEDDFLYLITVLSNKNTSNGLYPYKKTIINIFKGNKRSLNAIKFKETDLFGKYTFFNSTLFEDLLNKYKHRFIREYEKNGKLRYYANKDLKEYVKMFCDESIDNKIIRTNSESANLNEFLDEFFK